MMNATQTAATPNQILSGYSMDYTMQIEYAMRPDGQWFSRCQYRDARYGYKWSAWRAGSGPSSFTSETSRKARLPK